MQAIDIVKALNAKVVVGEHLLNREVDFACSSDLLSDLLRFDHTNVVLITGLATIQMLRTAEVSDIRIIVLVRGKQATPEMIELAKELDMLIMEFPGSLFKASGILFGLGLKPVF